MGSLDFLDTLKDKALDVAHIEMIKHTYELQNKNMEQLERNNELLEKDRERLQEENDRLQGLVAELEAAAATQKERDHFTIYEGFAFCRNSSGEYAPEAYCPQCYSIMSNLGWQKHGCSSSSCEYEKRSDTNPDVLARQLAEAERGGAT